MSELCNCAICPLNELQSRRVPARGKKTAQVLIVGQSPGDDEIAQGKPFVGPAGQCLEACLERAGWDVNSGTVAYANTVQCRPEEGFKFTRKTIDACKPQLEDTIRKLPDLKLIICVGNEAWASVIGGNPTGVEKGAGTVKDTIYGVPALWTHHPAKVLYSPQVMGQFIGHLAKGKKIWDGSYVADPAADARKLLVRDLPSLLKLAGYCRRRAVQGDVMAYDIETTSKDRFLGEVLGVALGFTDFGAYVLLRHGVPRAKEFPTGRAAKPEIEEWVAGAPFISEKHPSDPKLLQVTAWDLRANPALQDARFMEELRALLEDPDVLKSGFFQKFDSTFLQRAENIVPRSVIVDPILLQTVIDENFPMSLKYLSRQTFGATNYDENIQPYYKPGKNLSMAPLNQVAEYACLDVIYTARLAEKLGPVAAREGSRDVHDRLLLPLSRELGQMELRGMRVDVDAVHRVRERIEARLVLLKQEINDLTGFGEMKLPCRGEKDKQIGVNPNSDDDVRYILFDHFRLPGVKTTDTGKQSIDKKVRKTLLEDPDLNAVARKTLEAIGEFSKLNTYLGTFVNGTLDAVRQDGNAHCSYGYSDRSERSPATGRLSCNSPNLQNVIEAFQPCYIPSSDVDWCFLQADYRAIEVRVWAALSRCEKLMELFVDPDLDFHRTISAAMLQVNPEDVSDEQRKKLKVVLFSSLYGGDHHIISEMVGCSEDEAQLYQQRLFETFPRGKEWMDEQIRMANEEHRVVSPIGRSRHLMDVLSVKRDVRQGAERMAQNSCIQGLASDCNLMALISVADHLRWGGTGAPWLPTADETSWEWLGRRRQYQKQIEQGLADIISGAAKPSYRAHLQNTVHDCLIIASPEQEAAAVTQMLNEQMTRVPYPEWPEKLPLAIEVSQTKRWHADDLDLEKIVASVQQGDDEKDGEISGD